MVFVTQDQSGLQELIPQLGGLLGGVLQKRNETQRRASSGSIIQNAIDQSSIDPSTGQRRDLGPMELISALTQAQAQGAFPEDVKSFGSLYSTLSKQMGDQKGKQQKVHQLKVGMATIGKIDKLLEKGNVGTTLGFRLDPFANLGETGMDRSEFQKLGQSLIPLVAAGVSIRNQKEFDEYKSLITNPNASTSQIKGALNGLRQLIATQLEEYTGESPSISESAEVINTPREETKVKLSVGDRASNPKTGEKLEWNGKKWRKVS